MKVPRKKSAASKTPPSEKQPAPAKKPSGKKEPSAGGSLSKKKPGDPKTGAKQPSAKKESATEADATMTEIQKVLQRLRAQLADPENQDCVWVVELVIPPGVFMARRVEAPVDHAALDQEIAASIQALRKGNDPERHRFLITTTDVGGVARQYAKAMCKSIPNPTVPMRPYDLFTIDAVLHAQFIGDEEY